MPPEFRLDKPHNPLGVRSIQDELPGPAYALLSGLNSATVEIVALAAVQLSQKAVTDVVSRSLVFFGAAAGMLYNALWYFPVLLAVGGLVTIVSDLRLIQRTLRAWRRRTPGANSVEDSVSLENLERRGATPSQHQASPQRETIPTITRASEQDRRQLYSWKTGVIVLALFFVTFTIIMICRGIYSNQERGFDLFANMYLAGTIIFGGGPVVIPLLREYIVTPGWAPPRDFLLGLAIIKAFPGPTFNFAVYLGALAV